MKVADRQPAPKARNSVLNAKATNVSLAVFPYEIVFTANLDYTSAFYFEKGNTAPTQICKLSALSTLTHSKITSSALWHSGTSKISSSSEFIRFIT